MAIPDVIPVAVEPSMDVGGLYVGIGASKMSLRNDLSEEEFSSVGVMLQLGYQLTDYLAIEGRYTKGVGDLKYDRGITANPDYDDYDGDFSNIGIYLKPMYGVEDFNVYALLGYGQVELTNIPLGGAGISADRAESGFQWGLGASYDVSESVSVSVDYVRFYDDKGFDFRASTADIVSDAWTLAVSYRF
ncbi:MAG: porin family protein [Sulfurovum sp.]|nr:porin family protein [Sulfurovum sp.]